MADDLTVTREGDMLVKDLYLGVNAYVYAESKSTK